MGSFYFLSSVLLALISQVFGQTFTDCNPLKKTCPSDPALGTSFNETYTMDSSFNSDYWKIDGGPTITYDDNGALFTINQHGDAPTIQTNFYIFFGRVEILMRAASGQGIVSSLVIQSDDLDEIDWEIIGSNSTHVETNYYGKGDREQMNALWYPCDNPQGGLHNYTTVWTAEQLEWHLDGNVIRTLPFVKAVDNGQTIYPQTPSFIKVGSWAAGDPSVSKGTRQWAGGMVHYDQGPFNMYIKSIKIVDGTNNAVSYTYGDQTGDWQSIKIKHGESTAAAFINAPPPMSISERWNSLSPTVRIVIAVVVGVVLLLLVLGFVWYCIHQRRLGRRERAAADAEWEQDQRELLQYKQMTQRVNYGKSPGYVGVVQVRR